MGPPVWLMVRDGAPNVSPRPAGMILDRRSFLQLVSASAAAAALEPARALGAIAGGGGFGVRALELCGPSLWQWRTVDRSLELMERLGLNTLILGQDDLPYQVVWPRAYFSEDFMYAQDPVHMTVCHTASDYLRQVVRRAGRSGVQVFLEAKEISCPPRLVELHPELMETKGVLCPTHPLWWDFERARYREMVEQVPGLGGVVVSAGTIESQVALVRRNCTCERCRYTSPADWHQKLVRSLYEGVRGEGRRVVVRDFSSSRAEQDAIIEGASRVSPEIILSLKNTPQDFCPVFPDNPRLGIAAERTVWVEYDAMGQFSGQGVFPVGLVPDLSRRLEKARRAGARGVTFRADLEAVSDATIFNSLNLFNLCAGAAIAGGGGISAAAGGASALGVPDPLLTESENGEPEPLGSDAADRFRRFMDASWEVMAKAAYVRGLAFTDGGGQWPDSVDAAFDDLIRLHGREEWEPGVLGRIELTEENIQAVLAEKAEAERGAAALGEILRPGDPDMPAGLRRSLQDLLELYAVYVGGFGRAAAAVFRARQAMAGGRAEAIKAAREAAAAVDRHAGEAEAALARIDPPFFVRRLVDPAAGRRLAADVREKMAEIEWRASHA